MKKSATFILLLLFALCVSAQSAGTAKHEVMTGETLSSIARSYGTSVKELLKLNPKLDADHVMAGQKINVPNGGIPSAVPANNTPSAQPSHNQQQIERPKYKTTHEVQKKETIYSVSRMYGITEEQLIEANPELRTGKLKKGAVINIPYTEAENKAHAETVRKAEEEAAERRRQEEILNRKLHVAVILPFALSSESMTAEAQKMANLYQGFLLAVDTLKHQGYTIDVYAYDESRQDINGILGKPMMKNMSLIVGPMKQQSVATVADFAKSNGIVHVVPIASEVSLVNGHPMTFQMNVASSLLYPEAGRSLATMHESDNIVFLSMNDHSDNLAFLSEAKHQCDKAGKAYAVASLEELGDKLNARKLNVIVPSASSQTAFTTLCSKLSVMELQEGTRIQLFGYPEWQTFSSKQQHNLSKYTAQFFTPFYHQPSSRASQAFAAKFLRWFNQQQYNSLPRYGELGYDIGTYFLKAIKQSGKDVSGYVADHEQRGLEFPIRFERKDEGSGWQNRVSLIVTYRADGSVTVR